ncbi:hypothetical protein [Kribbella shirazensis]|uniref:Uncharacterized protein n=1 Tax=Kribbella shirazensis TaxID=1105143 RepID=A0A7X5VJJ6_9ACTN|nr:hypothetical protein [Kribbella shirazensis]NIK61567.1 hypothetical protein [Kribbella shirazensis]
MRAYRRIWQLMVGLWIALGLAAGLVTLPLRVWLICAILTALIWLSLYVEADSADRRKALRTRTAPMAFAVCLAIIATLATAVFLNAGALVIPTVMLASSPQAVAWYCGRLRRDRPSPERQRNVVSTDDLCREWIQSYDELNRAPSAEARLRVVMARQRCLDELERRDPDGLHAWLASTASAAGDPRRFLSDTNG